MVCSGAGGTRCRTQPVGTDCPSRRERDGWFARRDAARVLPTVVDMSSLAVLAGITSTVIFAGATLPMLRKAALTRDLASYSLGNIGLANVGNAVHSVYVLHLPPGPIWVLHAFYVLSSALMLFWYVRYVLLRRSARPDPTRSRPAPQPAGL